MQQNQSTSIGSLAKALSAAQVEFKPLKREAVNPYYKSKYAPLSAIIEAVREGLAHNGLAVPQVVSVVDGQVVVRTKLLHESNEWIESELALTLKSDDPQSIGSAITYARRYSLAAILCVAAEDDDDGNQATRPAEQAPIKEPQRKPSADPLTAVFFVRDVALKDGETKGRPWTVYHIIADDGAETKYGTFSKSLGDLALTALQEHLEVRATYTPGHQGNNIITLELVQAS